MTEEIRFLQDSPLRYLLSLEKWMAWYTEQDPETVGDQLADAMREHMRAYGARAALPVAELMEYRIAEMEEFTEGGSDG